MKVTIDEDACIGCQLCEDRCPDIFEVGADGISHVIIETIGPERFDCVREAADVCPTEAIGVTEEETDAP